MDLKEIMTFLKSQEEVRRADREDDRKVLNEMGDKIRGGIKEELKEMMRPLEERTAKVEENVSKVQDEVGKLALEVRELKEMRKKEVEEKAVQESERKEKELRDKDVKEKEKEQIDAKERELSELKETVARLKEGPVMSYATVAARGLEKVSGREKRRETTHEASEDKQEKVRIMFAAARLVVGLRPITKEDVKECKKLMNESGENEGKSEEMKENDARVEAAEQFLKMEMKMADDDIKNMGVEKIFAPNKDNWDTLYVRLDSEEDVSFLMAFKKYMRKGVEGAEKAEVINYIPKELFTRYKAVTKIGNEARYESGKTINFRVTLGDEDFRLQYKTRGSKFWDTPVHLPEDLPGIEHQLPQGNRSPGEAPGRRPLKPEQEKTSKRGRPASTSTGLTPPNKKSADDDLEAVSLVGEATITPVKEGEGLMAACKIDYLRTFEVTAARSPSAKNTK